MKWIQGTILLLLAALLCGCTGVPPQDQPATNGIPDLTGRWSGTMIGFEQGTGYTDYSGAMMFIDVTEQQGRIFSGTFSYGSPWENDPPQEFAGVIDRNGRTLTVVEQDGGYSSGMIVSENEIELVYAESGGNFSIAIDTLRRS
ncbi:hypothetical protein ASZ90_016287 [hydrocarbon metagenome]|uniref:Lipocalin-like domain-containing protein n=1 Tax=hydrocarbon metagenome TaxID=938273 RepID=A0A0W8EZM5_9ZZZZ